ncbi:hypothetical protein ACG7TL_007052 [Trametes sanguinea]
MESAPGSSPAPTYKNNTWIPGTIISGPFFSTLLLTQAFEVEFVDADNKRVRRCFRARDVRPASLW